MYSQFLTCSIWIIIHITIIHAGTISSTMSGEFQNEILNCTALEPCTVLCQHSTACRQSIIHCPPGYPCTVTCASNDACKEIVIYAQYSSSFDLLDCATGSSTCVGLSLYLPPNDHGTPRASVIGADRSFSAGKKRAFPLQFYAIYGWNDIDFVLDPSFDYREQGGVMHCTAGYLNTCDFSTTAFSCVDPNDICHHPPTKPPTINPTMDPTIDPTYNPTFNPAPIPTIGPTYHPTHEPTNNPSSTPSSTPTIDPTTNPSLLPSYNPLSILTNNPSQETSNPSLLPTIDPTTNPSLLPTIDPTSLHTTASIPTTLNQTTISPTLHPVTTIPTYYIQTSTANSTLFPSIAAIFPSHVQTSASYSSKSTVQTIFKWNVVSGSFTAKDPLYIFIIASVSLFLCLVLLMISWRLYQQRQTKEEDPPAYHKAQTTSRCGSPIPNTPSQECELRIEISPPIPTEHNRAVSAMSALSALSVLSDETDKGKHKKQSTQLSIPSLLPMAISSTDYWEQQVKSLKDHWTHIQSTPGMDSSVGHDRMSQLSDAISVLSGVPINSKQTSQDEYDSDGSTTSDTDSVTITNIDSEYSESSSTESVTADSVSTTASKTFKSRSLKIRKPHFRVPSLITDHNSSENEDSQLPQLNMILEQDEMIVEVQCYRDNSTLLHESMDDEDEESGSSNGTRIEEDEKDKDMDMDMSTESGDYKSFKIGKQIRIIDEDIEDEDLDVLLGLTNAEIQKSINTDDENENYNGYDDEYYEE